MLTQEEADALMAMPKRLVRPLPIAFPPAGDSSQIELKSLDGREDFLVDVNRRGKIKVAKCTYQERYAVIEILVRLDLGGPAHENPDGSVIVCPHLHVFREGYADKWAQPLPSAFTKPSDLIRTLQEFLRYCSVTEVPDIQGAIT
jgi:hypothetical protein